MIFVSFRPQTLQWPTATDTGACRNREGICEKFAHLVKEMGWTHWERWVRSGWAVVMRQHLSC